MPPIIPQSLPYQAFVPPPHIPPPPPFPPVPPVISQPLPYQAFVPPPPQPQNFPQIGARVDYNAQLLEGFNQTHARRRNQRRHRSSTAHVEPGPLLPPPQIHQHVINPQHETENQRYLQAQQEQGQQLQQQLQQEQMQRQEMEHCRQLQVQQELVRRQELENQRLFDLQQQQLEHQRLQVL